MNIFLMVAVCPGSVLKPASSSGSLSYVLSKGHLESRRLSTGVSQMQNFHEVPGIVDLVVNHNGAVYQGSHARALANGRTHSRESLEELQMVKQRLAKFAEASASSSPMWATISARSLSALCV